MRLSAVAFAAVATALAARASPAQVITLDGWNGELGVSMTGHVIDRNAAGNRGEIYLQEWAELALTGALRDTSIARYRLSLRPRWRQTKGVAGRAGESGGLTALGWSAGLTVFPQSPLRLSLGTYRDQQRERNVLGTEFEYRLTNYLAGLLFTNRYLPLEVQYRLESRDNARLQAPGEPAEVTLDQSLGILTLVAENPKTSLRLERRWLDKRGLTGIADRHRFRHRFRWGKGSRIRTGLSYNADTRGSSFRDLGWTEVVHLQHTRTVSSDYDILFNWWERGTGNPGREQRLGIGVNWQLAPRLYTTVGARRRSSHYSEGRQTVTGLRSGAGYSVPVGSAVRWNVRASVLYDRYDRDPTDAGLLLAIDEVHVFDVTGSLTLDNNHVIGTSVRVTSADGSLLFVPGIDYQLIELPPQTQVLIIPTGRLAPGDTVSVDYEYEAFAVSRTRQLIGAVYNNAQFRRLRVYQRLVLKDVWNGTTEGDENAPAAVLDDVSEFALGAQISPSVSRTKVAAGLEWLRRWGSRYYSNSVRARASVTIPLGLVILNAHGSGQQTMGSTGDFRTLVAGAGVNWTAARFFTLGASLAVWRWELIGSGQTSMRHFRGGDVHAEWNPGLLRFRLRYATSLTVDGINLADNQFSAYLSRRF